MRGVCVSAISRSYWPKISNQKLTRDRSEADSPLRREGLLDTVNRSGSLNGTCHNKEENTLRRYSRFSTCEKALSAEDEYEESANASRVITYGVLRSSPKSALVSSFSSPNCHFPLKSQAVDFGMPWIPVRLRRLLRFAACDPIRLDKGKVTCIRT